MEWMQRSTCVRTPTTLSQQHQPHMRLSNRKRFWNRTIAGHEAFGPRLNLSSTHTGDCTSVGLNEVVPSKQPTPLHQQERSPKSSARERIKLHHSNCNRRALRKSLPKKHKPKRRKATTHPKKERKQTNKTQPNQKASHPHHKLPRLLLGPDSTGPAGRYRLIITHLDADGAANHTTQNDINLDQELTS